MLYNFKKISIILSAVALISCKPVKTDKGLPEKLPEAEKIPVLAWHGVNREYMSVERFKEAAEMGVTMNYSRTFSVKESIQMLNMAKEAGIGCFIEIGNDRYSSAERAKAVAALKEHPALAGYFCADEPGADKFEEVAAIMREVMNVDNNKPCYCNILPGSVMPINDYEDYVENYLRSVPVKFLSFDQYPIINDGTAYALQTSWYNTLEINRRKAQKFRLPLWAFALTVKHGPYPAPTIEHLRLQAYSNLAYGAQTLQLFTYWSPSSENPEYKEAPINSDGSKSAIYDIVKTYLTEMQRLAYIFKGGQVEKVRHLAKGGEHPLGTELLSETPECAESISVAEGGKALVSIISNHGYRFMVVQNTDPNKSLELEISLKKGCGQVLKDGSIIPEAGKQKQSLGSGDILIYIWK